MRTILILVCALPGAWVSLLAQAVERTDTPEHGHLRVTFDPRILTWTEQFTGRGLEPLGAAH